jgi:hypothetical protein
MHPDLDYSLNFRDLQVRVAEAIGQADHSGDTAAPPTDALALDRIKRAINDAVADIARKASWLWLRQTVTITLDPDGASVTNIDSDATRYMLPVHVVSAPYGRVTWRNAANTTGGQVFSASTDRLLHLTALHPSATGAPQVCSVQAAAGVNRPVGSRAVMEMRVWPKPSEAFTMTCSFSVTPVPLVHDGDRGIWPAYMDLPIIRKAAANTMGYTDPEYAPAQQAADLAIAEARAHEGENRNRTLGRMQHGRPEPEVIRPNVTVTIPDIGFTME